MACISNDAYIEAAQRQADAINRKALIDVAIQVVLALWQRNSSASIANLQDEIAQRNIRLAEAVHDHAKKFWPAEQAIVEDAFAESKHEPQYGGLTAQWNATTADALRHGRTDWLEEARLRCLAPTRCEAARWDRVAQKSRADVISFAARQAEFRAETLNDMRFARQAAALALGKGILKATKSYNALAGGTGVGAGMMLSQSINSGLMALGYHQERTTFDGWGRGIRDSFARIPYQPPQPPVLTVPAPSQAQTFPVTAPVDLPAVSDPCPQPPAGLTGEEARLAWDAYHRCRGEKP